VVRTYEDARIHYRDGTTEEINLDGFLAMGGAEGQLLQCPDEAYVYLHKDRGLFELHCNICVENGCTGTKFQRVTQLDEHLKYFQANLETAYFKHSVDHEPSETCYCEELRIISNRASKISVRAIYAGVYLVVEMGGPPRFFLRARKPQEISSNQWALILMKFVAANEENFVGEESMKYFDFIQTGECPNLFVTEFTANIEPFKDKLEEHIYRINAVMIPHTSTAVWCRVTPENSPPQEIQRLKEEFSIDKSVLICTPLSPNQNGKIGFTNSSIISELFTLLPTKCRSLHHLSFKKFNDDSGLPPKNESYMCVDFGENHLHFSLFKKIGSEKQTLFESVEKNLEDVGRMNIKFNHREIKVLEFEIDYEQRTATFFVQPNQILYFILRHYDDSNDLRGKPLLMKRIKDLTTEAIKGSELDEEYAAKINSRDPITVKFDDEGDRYIPVRLQISGSGILEIQSDDGLTYQKRYFWEEEGTELSLTRLEVTHDYALDMIWSGELDVDGYTPPTSLERSEENIGARILDMLRHSATVRGATSRRNKLINLGFQNKVLDNSVGTLEDLKRSFTERMEIIRDPEDHPKFFYREGIAVGGLDSKFLLLIDSRPGHKLDGSSVDYLSNGCRLVPQDSDLVKHRLETLPELLMYPETPEEFLGVFLDEGNYSVSESALEKNFEKLAGYLKHGSQTVVYFMIEDECFNGMSIDDVGKGIEERSWTLRRKNIARNIWKSGNNHSQQLIHFTGTDGEDSTFQLVRTYSLDEDEQLYNPHIHQFYLVQYRLNKPPLAHKIFSSTSNDVDFYPTPLSDYFNSGMVDDQRFKRYQFLNDCIRAMYLIINKDKLSNIPNQYIIEEDLWYNIPSFLRHWLPNKKGSALSLLNEIRDKDSKLADFLELSIEKALWITS
jgi:hypothetical protein